MHHGLFWAKSHTQRVLEQVSNPGALILIVEDELPIRKLLRNALQSADYRLAEAATGQQAATIAAQQPPDLVILDLGF